MKRIILLAAIAICTGCSLNVMNGTLVYDSGDTRVKASRQNYVGADGERRTDIAIDTKADDEAQDPALIFVDPRQRQVIE